MAQMVETGKVHVNVRIGELNRCSQVTSDFIITKPLLNREYTCNLEGKAD